MICHQCYGKGAQIKAIITQERFCLDGKVEINKSTYETLTTCEECKGAGVVHCCDGLIANDQS